MLNGNAGPKEDHSPCLLLIAYCLLQIAYCRLPIHLSPFVHCYLQIPQHKVYLIKQFSYA